LEIKYLEYFEKVAQNGSINQAAKLLYISQPHLSHIIKEIEEEAGVQLFYRTRKGCSLTPDGEHFLDHCKIILKELERLKTFSDSSKPEKSTLNVSMTRFSHTAECFNQICRKHQDEKSFSFCLKEDAEMNVIENVMEGKSNVGVIHFASRESSAKQKQFCEAGLHFVPLALFQPSICLSRSHELLQNQDLIDLSVLKQYGFVRYIGQFEDFIYRITTQNLHLDLNESPKIVYVNDRAEQMSLISESDFFTIGITEFEQQDSRYQVVSIPLLGCNECLRFGVIYKEKSELTAAEKEFVELLIKHYHVLQAKEAEQINKRPAAFVRQVEKTI
jgi:DNA-binding transcriptional LysR family regulator